MPQTINYCQNLWAQFGGVEMARKRGTELLTAAISTGENVGEFRVAVIEMESELRVMQQVWDSSYHTLPDGKRLFGPQYDALKAISDMAGVEVGENCAITAEGKVKSLTLIQKNLISVVPLAHLPDLDSLHLGGNQITDLRPLSGLNNLLNLDLDNNPIEDIEPLGGLTKLFTLGLSGAPIKSLAPLANLGLGILYIRNMTLPNLNGLENCWKLQQLILTGSKVADISVLVKLPKLRDLVIIDTDIMERQPEVMDSLRKKGVSIRTKRY